MANYNLVVNSKFQPFSFERYIQPYQMYGEAYKEVENALGELATKASVWEKMANEQTDSYAYKMYKTYANDLEEQAGQLAREGLNAASRRDMLNMRARYSKEITPIEQAYTARQKQAEEQQKALLQDPTLMLSRRASTTRLEDYIRNPQLSYEAYSGKLLTAQAASAAGALAKEMQNNPRKWRSILGNSYYETMMQKGFSSDAVLKAVQGNPNAARELTSIVEDAISSSGIRKWGDQAIIDRAYEYARQGLWSAVGETSYHTLANKDSDSSSGDKDKGKRFALNPSPIYSIKELEKEKKDYKDNIDNFSKYFYKDETGQVRMNAEGWKEYKRKGINSSSGGSATFTNVKVEQSDSPLKQFLDSLGVNININSANKGIIAGDAWAKYILDSPDLRYANYDAEKLTEYLYDVPQSPQYQKEYKGKISRVIGSDEKLKEVDYDSKTGEWVEVGELSFADFDTDDYSLISRAPSELGTTLFIKKKGERAKRYLAPPGINITAEGARDVVISEMLKVQRLLQSPNLKQTQREKLEEYYDDLTQQQSMFESQLDITNSTESQDYSPYYIQ